MRAPQGGLAAQGGRSGPVEGQLQDALAHPVPDEGIGSAWQGGGVLPRRLPALPAEGGTGVQGISLGGEGEEDGVCPVRGGGIVGPLLGKEGEHHLLGGVSVVMSL